MTATDADLLFFAMRASPVLALFMILVIVALVWAIGRLMALVDEVNELKESGKTPDPVDTEHWRHNIL